MENKKYKICKKCIMDTSSDPNLRLDKNGVCNYCNNYDIEKEKLKTDKEKKLHMIVSNMKDYGKNREYDCVLGLSGGVDSSYMAHIAKKMGLRVLAVHVDAGWNSEIAVENIQKICRKLGYDLHTVVVDWETIKEIQRAFFFSGLANLDTVQDHVFAAAVYQLAKKYKIKYILNGTNLATEGILSSAWQNNTDDWRLIKDVCRIHGRGRINFVKYPHYTFSDKHFWFPRFYRFKRVLILDYIQYSKKMAMELLQNEYGWVYYGGKHYESRLTKFIQEYYLPERYGWDKRRDHLSSLIVGGEMTREEALDEIAVPIENRQIIEEDIEYILKKLDITQEELKNIMSASRKTAENYKNQNGYEKILRKIKKIIKYNQG